MSNQIFSTGALQSPADYRDVPLAAVTPTAGAKPASYFIDVTAMPVWHQHAIGACVGHAAGKYKQKLDHLETGKIVQLSARFLYALAKCKDGVADEGTYPRLVAKLLKEYGCATENTIPNDTLLDHETYVYNRKQSNIPAAAFAEALQYAISGYAFPTVSSIDDLKTAILQHNGAMLLMKVGSEWWTSPKGVTSWQAADVVPLRAPKTVVSGHEVYLYGYEDVVENGKTRTKFYVFNSWSTAWGLSGKAYFYFDEYSPYLVEAITFVDLPNDWQQKLHALPTKETFSHEFTVTLTQGQRNAEVTALQTALMIDGSFDATLYAQLLKSSELGYYGQVTAAAVLTYQKKHNVASLAELTQLGGRTLGPKTRASLNAWTKK